MNKNKIFLLVVGLSSLITSAWGWVNYFQENSVFSMLSWPFFWLGIFVWGDGMILGSFLFLGSIFLWFKNKSILSGMFFSAYATIRSFIEILYNLNAQFSSVNRPWEVFMPELASRLHLQVIGLHVGAQIGFTAIFIISMLVFISYLKKYFKN